MENHLRAEQTQAEERERRQFLKMTTTPIPKLIVTLAIPTMLNMMVSSLYNLADTYFVSGLGEDATGAVSVVLSLMSVIQAIGYTFGMGAGSIISRLLGKRAQKEADEVSSSAFFAAGAAGLIILIVGFIFLTPLMWLFGSSSQAVLENARRYSRYILLAAPFMCMSFVMNNLLRSQGKAVLSMIGLVTGAVINVGLDPLFITGFGMGIDGAGLATCLSQIISFLILLFMFLSGRSITRLRVRSVARRGKVYWEVISTGFPSFCRQILASLCSVFLNWAVKEYGDGALAAMGVVQKVFMFAFSIALGVGQGFQPVLGYNYSAGKFGRVRKAYLFTLGFSMALMTVFAVCCAAAAPAIMRAFLHYPESRAIGTLALRLQCICMPLLPLNFMAGLTYQIVGNKAVAALLSCSRQGLFFIPAILILPVIWDLTGVQCAQAVSDAFAFLFAVPFTVSFMRRLKRLQKGTENVLSEGISEHTEGAGE